MADRETSETFIFRHNRELYLKMWYLLIIISRVSGVIVVVVSHSLTLIIDVILGLVEILLKLLNVSHAGQKTGQNDSQ